MSLLLKAPYGSTLTDAFALARDRGILPTWMGTAELRDLEAGIKERAVFSARTTNAVYLEELRKRIMRMVEQGYNSDVAQLRLELKDILAELLYDPETGFPGDEELEIPPAAPGSLQDLSSDRRINLILDTQLAMLAGKGQQQRGLEPEALDLFPAYELVRIKQARVPRDWQERWEQAGGTLIRDTDGRVRLVALKTSEIWSLLGDPAIFRDALGVSYPPFAFGSGTAWDVVEADEWDRLWKLANPEAAVDAPEPKEEPIPEAVKQLPPATVSSGGLTREALLELRQVLRSAEQKDGKLSLRSIFSEPPPPPPPSSARPRINAERLLALADYHEQLNAHKRKPRSERQGVPCGDSFISKDKRCLKGVELLSSDESMTVEQAAEALEKTPHHNLVRTLRHWFHKSYKRLNQQPNSKETQQLMAFIKRIEPTPLDVPLYRGMRFANRDELAAFVAKVKSGQWPDMPINAFSKRTAVAARFSAPHDTDDGQFNAVIKLSRTRSGRDIRPLADVIHPAVSHQEEVIFLPGTKFQTKIEVLKTEGGLTAVITGYEEDA